MHFTYSISSLFHKRAESVLFIKQILKHPPNSSSKINFNYFSISSKSSSDKVQKIFSLQISIILFCMLSSFMVVSSTIISISSSMFDFKVFYYFIIPICFIDYLYFFFICILILFIYKK